MYKLMMLEIMQIKLMSTADSLQAGREGFAFQCPTDPRIRTDHHWDPWGCSGWAGPGRAPPSVPAGRGESDIPSPHRGHLPPRHRPLPQPPRSQMQTAPAPQLCSDRLIKTAERGEQRTALGPARVLSQWPRHLPPASVETLQQAYKPRLWPPPSHAGHGQPRVTTLSQKLGLQRPFASAGPFSRQPALLPDGSQAARGGPCSPLPAGAMGIPGSLCSDPVQAKWLPPCYGMPSRPMHT